jgi:site-specific DNA-methyltransferase (adenine-specific)
MAMNVDQLREDPANARKHPKKNIEALKHSLGTFGMQKPLVVLADGTVIAGNGQLRAAKALGWEQVPVVVFQDLAKAKAYAIADNRTAELAEWDDDILADTLAELGPLDGMGFENDELVSLGVLEPPLLPLDEAPEPPKTPTLKTGQLFALGRHRLLCGDSTRAESCAKLMNGEQAKLIFTDPPYGVAYGSKTIGAGNPDHSRRS